MLFDHLLLVGATSSVLRNQSSLTNRLTKPSFLNKSGSATTFGDKGLLLSTSIQSLSLRILNDLLLEDCTSASALKSWLDHLATSLVLLINRFKSLGLHISLSSMHFCNLLLLTFLLLVLLVFLDELIKSELLVQDSVHLRQMMQL